MAESEGNMCNATNMVCKPEVSPESGKKFVKHTVVQNADMRLESGTCNVCSAPCSSCMHRNRDLMGSKAKEFSDENCRSGEAEQSSMGEGNGSSLRSRACERLKHAASETSNTPSVHSSHDSLSENAESRCALSGKYQDSKCLEGLDDNTSCISRSSNANLVSGCHQINSDRTNNSFASVSRLEADGSGVGDSVNMSGLSEILPSKDADILENLSEGCMANVDSSLTKERASVIVSCEKSFADKYKVIDGNAKDSLKIHPNSIADTDNVVGDAKDEDHKHSVHDGQPQEKVEELVKSPVSPDHQSEDESDESDVVEHDVKVCDICGDAGREDLLAICSRCSDGAEHTYCMREMLEKVPEGDWLCEECKNAEETASQRLDVVEKKNHKVSSISKFSGKRPSESMEVVTAAKRQALDSSTGSPKASSPKRIVSLSRESSFKSVDKGQVKTDQQNPIRNHPSGNDIELTRSLSAGTRSQTARSTLLKSNSFNHLNSKPRVKLVDEVVPQKLKGADEHISKSMETPAGRLSKSMSFRPSTSGHSSATEAKVKMLPSKSGTAQLFKGLRHAKESGAFERNFHSRIDRPLVCSTMSSSVVSVTNGDLKLTPRGETAKSSAFNSSREFKVNQDGKLNSLSKSMNSISPRSVEPQVSSERTSTNVDESQQGGLPRSRDTANQIDKTKGGSCDRVRSGVSNSSKKPFCHKCKHFGHATECCTIGIPPEFGVEVSVAAASSSKEEMDEGNKLKAAIQAALLRRPEIQRKKVPDQTGEFRTSGTDLKRDVHSQDLLILDTLKSRISNEETNARLGILESSSFETSKCSSVNDMKQLNLSTSEFCSQLRKADAVGPASGKPLVRDLSNLDLGISSILSKISAIPEYEYIWQGVFKVHRSGKPPDLYSGIQAHLSTWASPKVLRAVSKFSAEVSLNEVPRLSTWPSQFLQGGAKEDSIALYFFAKDIESYDRHYKGLLDHMIRNDLALKGIFDGVELLIFASNQLPENSQRWNMLFFLWGVFRGRRTNQSDSVKGVCVPSLNVMQNEKGFPTAVMTLSETRCSPKRMDEESVACGKDCSALLPSTSIEQGHMLSRNFDIKEIIFDQTCLGSQVNIERQDSQINTKSVSRITTTCTELCQEMNSTTSSPKDSVPEHGQFRESRPPESMGASVNSSIVEKKTDDISVKQVNSLSSGIPSDSNQEMGSACNISKDNMEAISERTNNDDNQPRPKRKQTEDYLNINMEATFQGDLTVKGVNCQLPNDKKVQRIDLSNTVMEASAVSCQKRPWNEVNDRLEDGERPNKKLQTGFSGIHGCHSSGAEDSFNGSFSPPVKDVGSSSVKGTVCEDTCNEKIIHEDLGAMERTFFPVDMLNSLSLKQDHEYGDQFQVGFPNLELGLGGETKRAQKGMLPFFVGAVDQKSNQEKTPETLTDEQEDDSVAASLSLSLSFPSSNKDHTKPVPEDEHLPDGHHVNTSLLLFGRFTDK